MRRSAPRGRSRRTVADVVHLLYPSHLIGGFQRFGYAFILCHFLHQPGIHFLGLLGNLPQVGFQFSGEQHTGIDTALMVLQMLSAAFALSSVATFAIIVLYSFWVFQLSPLREGRLGLLA